MKPEIYAGLNVLAHQALLVEKVATAARLQVEAMKRDGVPDHAMAPIVEAISMLRLSTKRLKRQCIKQCKGEPVREFVDGTTGLSEACFVFLGCIRTLTDFGTVSKLWKYCGLHVLPEGRAAKLGDLAKEDENWSPQLRAQAIVRLADPCIKHRASPYRATYDARRERTAVTHPDWTDGHSHNDARRVTAKAILRDLWLVENGRVPVIQIADDTQILFDHSAPADTQEAT